LDWLENDDDVSIIEKKPTSPRKKSVKRKLCFLDTPCVTTEQKEQKIPSLESNFDEPDDSLANALASMFYALACLGILGNRETEVYEAFYAEIDKRIKTMEFSKPETNCKECGVAARDSDLEKVALAMITKYGVGKYHLHKQSLPTKFLPSKRYLVQGFLNRNYVYRGTLHEQENREQFYQQTDHYIGLLPCDDSHLICCNQLPLCEESFLPIEVLHMDADGNIDEKQSYIRDVFNVYEIECDSLSTTSELTTAPRKKSFAATAEQDTIPNQIPQTVRDKIAPITKLGTNRNNKIQPDSKTEHERKLNNFRVRIFNCKDIEEKQRLEQLREEYKQQHKKNKLKPHGQQKSQAEKWMLYNKCFDDIEATFSLSPGLNTRIVISLFDRNIFVFLGADDLASQAQQIFHQLCISHLSEKRNFDFAMRFRLESSGKTFPVSILLCLRDICGWDDGQEKVRLRCYRAMFENKMVQLWCDNLAQRDFKLFTMLEEAASFVKHHLVPYIKQ